jgi:RNA polymerase sigma factor (sigma-70 family)
MEPRDDARLVAEALAEGADGFARLVDRYQDAVFAVAVARLGNFHDAQDVAQTVFLDAFERLGGLRNPARLGAWLRSIAIHKSLELLRRRRETEQLDEAALDGACGSAWRAEERRRDLREQVLMAVRRLSSVQRETTLLFYINGYSEREVAAIQEVPVGTVKRRLHDAREALRKDMAHMVEKVLKQGAPGPDFAQHVCALLNRFQLARSPRWLEVAAELRRIGSQGFAGFVRAMESVHSPTRVFAVHMLRWGARLTGEGVVELLKKALTDPNKKVRRCAVTALLDLEEPDERKRREFLPLVIPLLADRSRRVRRIVAWDLRPWAADVPIEKAVQAVLGEKDPRTRGVLLGLLDAVMGARGKA